jgi:hypothetical protein
LWQFNSNPALRDIERRRKGEEEESRDELTARLYTSTVPGGVGRARRTGTQGTGPGRRYSLLKVFPPVVVDSDGPLPLLGGALRAADIPPWLPVSFSLRLSRSAATPSTLPLQREE